MMDHIYYSYRFRGYKPKKMKWKIYCFFRKIITIKESPSKVMIWQWEYKDKEQVEE